MVAPKKPQDHKPKSLPVKDVAGGKQVTFRGLKIVVKQAALKDHRVVQGFADLQGDVLSEFEKIALNGRLIDRVLGKDQAESLVNKLADKDGFTDFTVLAAAFNEIMGAAYPNS